MRWLGDDACSGARPLVAAAAIALAAGCGLHDRDPLCAACEDACPPGLRCVSGVCMRDAPPARADDEVVCDARGMRCRLMRRARHHVALTHASDILFVIDNSASMAGAQARLAASFPSLFAGLRDVPVDYRIGVTTMDLDTCGQDQLCICVAPRPDGELAYGGKLFAREGAPAVLVPPTTALRPPESGPAPADAPESEAALVAQLRRNASVGTSGCGIEQGIEAARRTLAAPVPAVPFRRAGAGLVVVFLSDEDDCSHPPDVSAGGRSSECGDFAQSLYAPGELARSLSELATDPSRVALVAIVGALEGEGAAACRVDEASGEAVARVLPPDGACNPEEGACPGTRYAELIDAFTALGGGAAILDSVCRQAYAHTLERAGRIVADQTRGFCLREAPSCEDPACRGELSVTREAVPLRACCQEPDCDVQVAGDCWEYRPPDGACPRILLRGAARPVAAAELEVQYPVDARAACEG